IVSEAIIISCDPMDLGDIIAARTFHLVTVELSTIAHSFARIDCRFGLLRKESPHSQQFVEQCGRHAKFITPLNSWKGAKDPYELGRGLQGAGPRTAQFSCFSVNRSELSYAADLI